MPLTLVLTCEGRLYSVPWNGESALMLVLVRTAAADRQRDAASVLTGYLKADYQTLESQWQTFVNSL